ncbi:MAG: hypothetical protein QM595_11395 [Nocardioides sp.]
MALNEKTVRTPAVVAAAVLVALFVLGGCGSQRGTDSAEDPTAPSTDSSNAPGAHDGTTCRELLDSGWKPPAAEPDVSWDPSTGEATFILGDEVVELVDVRDEECVKVPFLGGLIQTILAGAETDLESECASAVDSMRSGSIPSREGYSPGPDALATYIRATCPEKYTSQLDDIIRSVEPSASATTS